MPEFMTPEQEMEFTRPRPDLDAANRLLIEASKERQKWSRQLCELCYQDYSCITTLENCAVPAGQRFKRHYSREELEQELDKLREASGE